MLKKRSSQKRHNNKSLYESIIKDVSKVVKTCLNEALLNWSDSDIDDSGIIKTDDTVKKISEDDIIRSPEDIFNKIDPVSFRESGNYIEFKIDLSYLPWYSGDREYVPLFELYNIHRNTIIKVEFEYFGDYSEWRLDEDEIYELFGKEDEDLADEIIDYFFEHIDNWLAASMYEHLDLN